MFHSFKDYKNQTDEEKQILLELKIFYFLEHILGWERLTNTEIYKQLIPFYQDEEEGEDDEKLGCTFLCMGCEYVFVVMIGKEFNQEMVSKLIEIRTLVECNQNSMKEHAKFKHSNIVPVAGFVEQDEKMISLAKRNRFKLVQLQNDKIEEQDYFFKYN